MAHGQKAVNAFLHFRRGFLREGQGEDVFCWDPLLLDKPSDSVRDDGCLPCSRTCDNHEGAALVRDGFLLPIV